MGPDVAVLARDDRSVQGGTGPRGWCALLLLAFGVLALLVPSPPAARAATRPNIVLIVTDDQRWDTLSVMPILRSSLANRGVTFTNGFVANALCCPSRANILKGAYSHSTKVYQNAGPNGPFGGKFDDSSTIATWLDRAGYRTALLGKYFNGYTPSRASYVPPGWDRWYAFSTDDIGGGKYFDYSLSSNGRLVWFGRSASDYSTDVLAREADRFIRTTVSNTPLFLYFAPYAPHLPSTPAPRHATAFSNLAPSRPPNHNEANVSDKPAYIRNLPLLSAASSSALDRQRLNYYRTLLAVDEGVGKIVDALAATGRLDNTIIVFTSDNGYAFGEHRWGATGSRNKQVPYEESIRVPFVVRYDAAGTQARTDARMALNIDLAPTFAALAGVAAPGAEGRSLLPLLSSSTGAWRNDFLIEHHATEVPSYCSVRSQTHLYVQYHTGEEELYVLASDPYQLENRAGDAALHSVLTGMRTRAHELCSPPPPGFTFRR